MTARSTSVGPVKFCVRHTNGPDRVDLQSGLKIKHSNLTFPISAEVTSTGRDFGSEITFRLSSLRTPNQNRVCRIHQKMSDRPGSTSKKKKKKNTSQRTSLCACQHLSLLADVTMESSKVDPSLQICQLLARRDLTSPTARLSAPSPSVTSHFDVTYFCNSRTFSSRSSIGLDDVMFKSPSTGMTPKVRRTHTHTHTQHNLCVPTGWKRVWRGPARRHTHTHTHTPAAIL